MDSIVRKQPSSLRHLNFLEFSLTYGKRQKDKYLIDYENNRSQAKTYPTQTVQLLS
jgi:hypothetical protein